jgi:hypothetical protein
VTPPLLTLFLQAVSAFAIALFSAWLTVKLSHKRFRSERMWDRKVVAYERVIEAFHKSKKFSSEHLDAEHVGRDLSEERDKELRRLAHEAMEEIRRTRDIGSFTLSPAALKILANYERESDDDAHITTWYEHIEHDFEVTNKYMKLFIAEAKRDLAQ